MDLRGQVPAVGRISDHPAWDLGANHKGGIAMFRFSLTQQPQISQEPFSAQTLAEFPELLTLAAYDHID
jgi:hypothetical protein